MSKTRNEAMSAESKEPTVDSSAADQGIAYCKIHPGLGIARLGNSPDEFFIGPLAPGEVPNPEGGFKDKLGRIKRQAAEFRIYGYNKDGVAVKELTADDAEITWSAHLVNRKAEHHQFVGRFWQSQIPEFYKDDPTTPPLRNQEVPDPKEREKLLVIDPGPRNISGRRTKDVKFDNGSFGPLKYTVISLGTLDDSDPENPVVGPSNSDAVKGSRTGNINEIYPIIGNAPPPQFVKLWEDNKGKVLPPHGHSSKVEVPLGELQTDEKGRLLVLGGFGKSESVMPLNPIGFLNITNYFANNDYWYDDTSDGPVTATVKLKNGRSLEAESAWVLVTPPKYSVAARCLTTLYDIAEETWQQKINPARTPAPPSFTKDIYPIVARLQQYHWLNAAAFRGHGPGPGQQGNFLNPQGQPSTALYKKGPEYKDAKQHIFRRLRKPDLVAETPQAADSEESRKYASSYYMPQMSGDGGDVAVAQDASPESPAGAFFGSFYVTWLTLTATQYRNFELWAKDDFESDWTGTPPPVLPIHGYPVCEQPAMLDKGALDPCIGGAFFPGIEVTYIATHPDTWSGLCRVNAKFRPGDITRWMALPWQADFSECNTNWWPAARPDNVVPESEYKQVLASYTEGLEGQLEAALANRVLWSRGIPTQSPGLDNSMIHAWKDFGFIVPRKYPRDEPGAQTVYIETERTPYVEVSIRDAFFYLMNIESYQDFLPKAHAMVEGFLAESWRNQELMMADTDQVWKFFPFTQEAFDTRLQLVYDNYVRDNQSAEVYAGNLQTTRDSVINRLLQLGPFNQLDGAWLRHITPDGPLSNIGELLFRIRMDELGDGNPQQNHANVYTDLLKSVNIYLPDLHTQAYAQNPALLDSAFVQAVFLLAISQFDDEFFPELLGMTLELEWGSVSLPVTVDQLTAFGINPLYYQLHVGIDNASVGHGAIAKQAVEMYLEMVRQQQGEGAMQAAWKRIWTGYLAFGTLGSLGSDLLELPPSQSAGPSPLWNTMANMIASKAPYASLMHGDIRIGENRLNDWFEDPFGLLSALIQAGIVIPGDLDSPMFQLMSFTGPMYHVFNDDEQQLWQRWVLSLPASASPGAAVSVHPEPKVHADLAIHPEPKVHAELVVHPEPKVHADLAIHPEPKVHADLAVHPEPKVHAELAVHPEPKIHPEPKSTLETAQFARPVPQSVTYYNNMRKVVDILRQRQQGVTAHNVLLIGPNPDQPSETVTRSLHWWFELGANLTGDGNQKAAQLKRADDLLLRTLSNEANGWIVKSNVLLSPLVTGMATGFGDMAEAFRQTCPGTGGKTYLWVLVDWIQAGCPIGEERPERKLAVGAVAALPAAEQRRRRHPWGMGVVH